MHEYYSIIYFTSKQYVYTLKFPSPTNTFATLSLSLNGSTSRPVYVNTRKEYYKTIAQRK